MDLKIADTKSIFESKVDGWFGKQSLMDHGFSSSAAEAALIAAGGSSEKGVRFEDFLGTFDALLEDKTLAEDGGGISLNGTGETIDDEFLEEAIGGVPQGGIPNVPNPNLPNLPGSGKDTGNAVNITKTFSSSTLGSPNLTKYLHSNVRFEGDTIILRATKETGAEIRSNFELDGIKTLYFTKQAIGPKELHAGSFGYVDKTGSEVDFGEHLGGQPTDGMHAGARGGGNENKIYNQRLNFSGTGLDPSKDAISYKYSFNGDQVTTSVKSAITGEYVQINQFRNALVKDVVENGKLMFSAWGEKWHDVPLTSGEVRISNIMVEK